MAEKYGITEGAVYHIRSRLTWKHLDITRYDVSHYATEKRPSGEKHHNSKLTDLERQEIENDDITPTSILASKFNVDRHTICNIRGSKDIPRALRFEEEAQYILNNPHLSNKELSKHLSVGTTFVANVKNRKLYQHLISEATEDCWNKYKERQLKILKRIN